MCIVSAEARLSKTKIMSMELDSGRHMLSYANKVDNISGKPNSMILAVPGKLKSKWFHDTSEYSDFLKDIENQAGISYDESMGEYYLGMKSKGMRNRGFESFSVGMYDIMITDDIDNIYGFNEGPGQGNSNDLLKIENRPEISEELLEFFRTQYKGWSFVVCVFDGRKTMESQPIAFEYEPFDNNWLYFPTMDCHTGGAPDLNEKITMEHSLIYEYPGLTDRIVQNVKFSQKVPQKFMRRNYVSTKWKERMQNGDMYLHLPTLYKRASDKKLCYGAFKRSAVHPGELMPA